MFKLLDKISILKLNYNYSNKRKNDKIRIFFYWLFLSFYTVFFSFMCIIIQKKKNKLNDILLNVIHPRI